MSRLSDFKFSHPNQLTQGEKEILLFALGERRCVDQTFSQFIDLYLVAAGAAITYLILESYPIDPFLRQQIDSQWGVIIVKALIILLVVYLLDRWIKSWRKRNTLCISD